MKLAVLLSLTLVSAPVIAADTKDEVKAAAKKLAESPNYSWTTKSETPGSDQGGRFRIGPTEGKTQKDGLTSIKMTRGENATEAFVKAGKAVVKTDGGWKTGEELSSESSDGEGGRRGGGRFLGRMLQNMKTPAAEAEDLAGKVKELKKADDGYAGELTEDAVKERLTFGGRRRDGSEPPAPANMKGSVKFWVKDGVLTKYEYNVQGTITFQNNDRDVNRTTTVEIKDVGSTKIDVPEEAKAKISS